MRKVGRSALRKVQGNFDYFHAVVCFGQWPEVMRRMGPQSRTGDDDDDNDEAALFFSLNHMK